jgi:Arc/MetJ family transcription regulator
VVGGRRWRPRERMGVDDETIAQATHAFGKIGSSTVGAAYAGTLRERRAAGERLGTYAETVAAHIRRNLQTYADAEHEGQQALST